MKQHFRRLLSLVLALSLMLSVFGTPVSAEGNAAPDTTLPAMTATVGVAVDLTEGAGLDAGITLSVTSVSPDTNVELSDNTATFRLPGVYTVTYTAADASGETTYTREVTVSYGLKVSPDTVEAEANTPVTLPSTVTTADGTSVTNYTISFDTSAQAAVQKNDDGTYTFLVAGSFTVIYTADVNGQTLTGACAVSVKSASVQGDLNVTYNGVALTEAGGTHTEEGTVTPTAKLLSIEAVFPSDATGNKVLKIGVKDGLRFDKTPTAESLGIAEFVDEVTFTPTPTLDGYVYANGGNAGKTVVAYNGTLTIKVKDTVQGLRVQLNVGADKRFVPLMHRENFVVSDAITVQSAWDTADGNTAMNRKLAQFVVDCTNLDPTYGEVQLSTAGFAPLYVGDPESRNLMGEHNLRMPPNSVALIYLLENLTITYQFPQEVVFDETSGMPLPERHRAVSYDAENRILTVTYNKVIFDNQPIPMLKGKLADDVQVGKEYTWLLANGESPIQISGTIVGGSSFTGRTSTRDADQSAGDYNADQLTIDNFPTGTYLTQERNKLTLSEVDGVSQYITSFFYQNKSVKPLENRTFVIEALDNRSGATEMRLPWLIDGTKVTATFKDKAGNLLYNGEPKTIIHKDRALHGSYCRYYIVNTDFGVPEDAYFATVTYTPAQVEGDSSLNPTPSSQVGQSVYLPSVAWGHLFPENMPDGQEFVTEFKAYIVATDKCHSVSDGQTCTCTEDCTPEKYNKDCPVCVKSGISNAKLADKAVHVVLATPKNPKTYVQLSQNETLNAGESLPIHLVLDPLVSLHRGANLWYATNPSFYFTLPDGMTLDRNSVKLAMHRQNTEETQKIPEDAYTIKDGISGDGTPYVCVQVTDPSYGVGYWDLSEASVQRGHSIILDVTLKTVPSMETGTYSLNDLLAVDFKQADSYADGWQGLVSLIPDGEGTKDLVPGKDTLLGTHILNGKAPTQLIIHGMARLDVASAIKLADESESGYTNFDKTANTGIKALKPGAMATYRFTVANNSGKDATEMIGYLPIPKLGQDLGKAFQDDAFEWDMSIANAPETVEGFLVTYGVGVTGENYTDDTLYKTRNQIANWDQVNMVRIVAIGGINDGASTEFTMDLKINSTKEFAEANPGALNVWRNRYYYNTGAVAANFDGSWAAAMLCTGRIAGTVYIDADRSGTMNETEKAGYNGLVTVSNASGFTQTYDVVNGTFNATGLMPGEYTVTVSNPASTDVNAANAAYFAADSTLTASADHSVATQVVTASTDAAMHITARLEAPYTVTYVSGTGATYADDTTQKVWGGAALGEPKQPTVAEGYETTVDVWQVKAASGANWGTDTLTTAQLKAYVVNEDIHVRPVPTGKQYKLHFDVNKPDNATSAPAAPSDMTVTYAQAIGELPTLANITDGGFNFLGWASTADATQPDVTATSVYNTLGNTTLYAVWSEGSWSVTYNTQGGSDVPPASVRDNELATKPSDPTRAGYTFGGWYRDADCTSAWNFASDKVTGNVTLYAKWTANKYKITLDPNSGDLTGASNTINVTYDAAIGALPTPTREGYAFGGWYSGTTLYKESTVYNVAGNLTLTAKWNIQQYDVIFALRDANAGFDDTLVPDEHGVYAVTRDYHAELTLADYEPTLTGKIFLGWFASEEAAQNAETTLNTAAALTKVIVPVDGTTVYAAWRVAAVNVYGVVANGIGATVTPSEADKAGLAYNGKQVITFTPDENYEYVDGSATLTVGSAEPVKINLTKAADGSLRYELDGAVLAADAYVTASFRYTAADLTVTRSGNGEGSFTFTIDDGEAQDLTFDAANTAVIHALQGQKVQIRWQPAQNSTTDSVKVNGTNVSVTDDSYTFDSAVNGQTLAVALRQRKYTIIYDPNMASITSGSKYVYTDNATVTISEKPDEWIPPVGYTFVGWLTDEWGYQPNDTYTFEGETGTLVLYAGWTNGYALLFDDNGVMYDPKIVTYGQPYGFLHPAPLAGFSMDGWYYGDTRITEETIVSVAADHTLTTRRTVLNPEVTLNAAAASGQPYESMESLIYWAAKPGDMVTLTANVTKYAHLTYTYQWYKDGVEIADAIGESYTFDRRVENGGVYKVKVTATATGIVTSNTSASTELSQEVQIVKLSNNVIYMSNIEPIISDCRNAGSTYATVKIFGKPSSWNPAGCTFVGWNTAADGSGTTYLPGSTHTFEDYDGNFHVSLTLYAQWERNEYTVSFDPNGGTAIAPIPVTYSNAYGTLPVSALAGFSMDGWFYGDTEITAESIVSVAADHTLTAHRTVLNPEVTLNAAAKSGQFYGRKDGYIYWAARPDDTVTLTANVTAYAHLTYTYQWYKDGVEIPGATGESYTFDRRVENSGVYKVKVTAMATDVTTSNTSASTELSQEVQITKLSNTVIYRPNIESITSGGMNAYSYNATVTIKAKPGNWNPVGYTFVGWNTAADGSGTTYQPNDSYTFEDYDGNSNISLTLYAQWKLNEYTVSFDAAGGTPVPDAQTVKHGFTAAEPAEAPAKSGYAFAGWYNGDTKYDFTTPVTGDLTLTAKYDKLYPVQLVIYRNGNTAKPYKTVGLEPMKKGDKLDVSALDIADYYTNRTGYVFAGWYNDGGWNAYKNGNPNNTIKEALVINGWTNIICMVTDYETVVVKSVTDGDKDGAETIFTGTALYGTNLLEYLNENVTLEEKEGYTLDKWYNWDWYAHKFDEKKTVTGWTNVYVTYDIKHFTVALDFNDAQTPAQTLDVTYGTRLSDVLPEATNVVGYDTHGWYYVGGGQADADAAVTQDMAFVIKRSITSHTVTLTPETTDRFYNGEGVTLTSSLSSDKLVYTYQWYKDGKAIEGATSANLALDGACADSGEYKLVVTINPVEGITVDNAPMILEDTASVTIRKVPNTLHYDANSGENAPEDVVTIEAQTTVSATVPTKTGYTFLGWNTAADGSGKMYHGGDVYEFVNGAGDAGVEATLYAQWQANHYTIVYHGNGGVLSSDHDLTSISAEAVYDAPVTLKNKWTFTYEKHQFLYWVDESGDIYQADAQVENLTAEPNGVVNLYAFWAHDMSQLDPVVAAYKVEHYLEQTDGTYVLTETEFPLYAEVGTTVNATVRSYAHYAFDGENANNVLSGEVVTPSEADGKLQVLTLKVYYKLERHTVTFHFNDAATATMTVTVPYGTALADILPETTDVAGYETLGWYLGTTKVDAETALTATENCALMLHRNIVAHTVTLTVQNSESDYDGNVRILNAAVSPVFDTLAYTYEWYRSENEGELGTLVAGENGNNLVVTGNVSDSGYYTVIVKANAKNGIIADNDPVVAQDSGKLTIRKLNNTLHYDGNGAENAPQDDVTTDAQTVVSDVVPTKTGYTFLGWNTKADGSGTMYQPKDAFVFANDVGNGGDAATLYAQWQANTYKIVYHGNDGTLTSDPTQDTLSVGAVYDTDVTLAAANTFTREGWVFLYWASEDGTIYEAEAVVRNLTAEANAEIHLNAIWVPEQIALDPIVAAYKVEHYLEQTDGTYVLTETELPLFGEIGTTVEAVAKSYAHYTFDAENKNNVLSGEVVMPSEVNGALQVLTLKVYYKLERHTVTYTDDVADAEIFADQSYSVAYGAETPAFVGTPVRKGYEFKGWTPEVTDTVTGDVVYSAVWAEKTVTPETGDGFNAVLWSVLLLAAACGMAGVLCIGKKRKQF